MTSSGQKHIGRNRAPRVQIEYDVELYGANKKVELPFVMGVMADLAGKQEAPPQKIEERKFLEIDHDNFDVRMKVMKPRVATTVANRISGKGSLSVDLTFESMNDFTPGALARKIAPLRELLDARKRLSDLITYMDGKGEAEALLSEKLKDPSALRRLMDELRAKTTDDAGAPADAAPTAEAE